VCCSLDRQQGVSSVYNRKQKEVKVECEDRIQVTAPNYFPIKPEEKDKRLSGVYSTRM